MGQPVPSEQLRQIDAQLEAVEGLYQEAQMMMPQSERAMSGQDTAPLSDAMQAPATDKALDDTPSHHKDEATARPIIRSRKPKSATQSVPLFTRITDLYEEAEASRYVEDSPAPSQPSTKTADKELMPDDDFAIPAAFGQLETSQESSEFDPLTPDHLGADPLAPDHLGADPSESELLDSDLSEADLDAASDPHPEESALQNTPLSEDDLADLVAETTPSDDVEISTELTPAVALDEVLDALSPPEDDAKSLSEEAQMLASMDAARPEADAGMIEKLAAVKSAVQAAQTDQQTIMADSAPAPSSASQSAASDAPEEAMMPDEMISDEGTSLQGAAPDLSSLSPGPALASFIGETVREVLDEELPQMVRGIVDEALGERQGRYGRSQTPHIGLRTKPARH